MSSGVLIAHVIRDRTDSRAIVRLPDKFNDPDEWLENHGPKWTDVHFRMVDTHIAINYGWDWDIDYLDWFESEEDYLDEFVNNTF